MRLRAHIFRRGGRLLTTLFLGVVLLGFATCSRKIGDNCKSNVECSPLGDRFCDLSSPNGYCTVEGCDAKSCPDGAACISFFSLQRGGPPTQCGTGGQKTCRIGERCLCDNDDCTVSYCASETTERRWCMQPCDDQGDCDPDYTCYPAGQGGTLAVSPADESSSVVKYCAPNRVLGN